MTEVCWVSSVAEDLSYWKKYDNKKYVRIKLLIQDIQENPSSGIGKPEPLKHSLSGLWSRRINHEHRLVYSVKEEQIIIYSCRFHYIK